MQRDQPQTVVSWEERIARHTAAIQEGKAVLSKNLVKSHSRFGSDCESDTEYELPSNVTRNVKFPVPSRYTQKFIRDSLISYYRHFFPFEEICAWLCYGKPAELCLREIAYTNWQKKFSRYQYYRYPRSFRYWMSAVFPLRIDIGAKCNREPRYKVDIPLRHVERELTFDVDLSDYNDVRMCCKNNQICDKCWKFIVVACEILQASLTEDFGWEHILWVFSGRRGVHCWVSDDDARLLDDSERRKVVEYISLKRRKGGVIDLGKKAQLPHHIERSGAIARKYFVKVCIHEQNILGTANGAKHFISLLPNETMRQEVTELFGKCASGREKWQSFHRDYAKDAKSLGTDESIGRPHWWDEIVLCYLYPRIDAEVTEKVNHLLKSPFSMHPETKMLCTPFDPRRVNEFRLSAVPNIDSFVPNAEYRADCILAGLPEPKSNVLDAFDSSLRVFRDFLASFGSK